MAGHATCLSQDSMHASVPLCLRADGPACAQTLMTWGLEGGAMPGQSPGEDSSWPRMQSALPDVAPADIFRYHTALMSCLRDPSPGTVFKVSALPRQRAAPPTRTPASPGAATADSPAPGGCCIGAQHGC